MPGLTRKAMLVKHPLKGKARGLQEKLCWSNSFSEVMPGAYKKSYVGQIASQR